MDNIIEVPLNGVPLMEAPPGKPLADHVLSLNVFQQLPIKPRDYLVLPWLASSSLNMVFAPRGIGKSWFVMQLALSLARGERFFVWQVARKRRVLLVDGEMPNVVIQRRFGFLAGHQLPKNLDLLTSEGLWLEGNSLNLNTIDSQIRFQQMLDDLEAAGRKPDLIVIDNLSSLTAGMDENSNTELDSLLHWLMGIRHQGYAVLLVHHSGKGGDQRGGSRREDLLDTSIKLEPTKDPPTGATFEITFVKTRDERPHPDRLLVSMGKTNTGKVEWKMTQVRVDDAQILRTIHTHAPKSQNALAKLLARSSTTVGKLLIELIKGGLVVKTPKLLALTEKGLALLEPPSRPRKFADNPPEAAKKSSGLRGKS